MILDEQVELYSDQAEMILTCGGAPPARRNA